MASRLDFSQIRSLYIGTSSSTTVDTNNLIVTGLVGVGTTSPSSQLSGTVGISIVNANNAALGLSNGTNNWLNYLSGTTYRIWNNTSNEVVTILLNGNVGIGTTSPANKLEVDGGSSATTLRVSTTNTGVGVASLILANSTKTAFNDGIKISHGAGYTNVTDLAGTSVMVWDMSNARVGIGTTVPSTALEVAGTVTLKSSAEGGPHIYRDGGNAGDIRFFSTNGTFASPTAKVAEGLIGQIHFQGYTGSQYLTGAQIWGVVDGTVNSTTLPGRLEFRTGTGSPSIQMVIKSNGNVGIGTTAPKSKIQIVGPTLTINNENTYAVWVSDSGDDTKGLLLGYDLTNDVGVIQAVDQATAWKNISIASNGGNVSIGTTTNSGARTNIFLSESGSLPNAILRLQNTGAAYQAKMIITDGTTNDAVIGYQGGYTSATQYLGFGVGTAFTQMILTAAGNVGIGTTNPIHKLEVAGNISINGGTYLDFANGDVRFVNSSGLLSVQTYSVSTGLSTKMVVTGAGNVGIGTTSPSTLLHLEKSSSSNNITGTPSIIISNRDSTSGTFISGGIFNNSYRDVSTSSVTAGIWFVNANSPDAGALAKSSDIVFGANSYSADWNTPVERMRITQGGNVGIGTTSPVNKLQVTSATNGVEVLRIDNTAGNSGSVQGVTHLGLNFFAAGNNSGARITAYQESTSGYRGGMYFSTRGVNSDSAPSEAMRISPDQLVGIGTSGTTAADYRLTVDSTGVDYAIYSFGSTHVDNGALGVGVVPSATIGRIDASNDIVAYSTSDQRLKENITPIANALDKVKSLTGVEFDWKEKTKHVHGYEGHDVGVIAQEVQAVLPEAIRTNDSGYLSVRYEKMIALLIEGMKEQQNQIDELKAKLDGLTK